MRKAAKARLPDYVITPSDEHVFVEYDVRMPSIYRKNEKWYLRFKDPANVWRDRASNARRKSEAKRLAMLLEMEAHGRRCMDTNSVQAPGTRPVASLASRETPSLTSPTVAEIFEVA